MEARRSAPAVPPGQGRKAHSEPLPYSPMQGMPARLSTTTTHQRPASLSTINAATTPWRGAFAEQTSLPRTTHSRLPFGATQGPACPELVARSLSREKPLPPETGRKAPYLPSHSRFASGRVMVMLI